MALIDDLKRNFQGQPVVNKLIIINVAVFLIGYTINLFAGAADLFEEWVGIPSKLTGWQEEYAIQVGPESSTSKVKVIMTGLIYKPWTLLTHMFAHAGIVHIFFNMLWLFFLGGMLVNFMGSRRVVSTFLLGGFASAAAFLLLYNVVPSFAANATYARGASGAVSAITLAVASFRPQQEVRLFGILPIKLAVLGVGMVLLDYLQLRTSTNVGGHVGHLGGAAYGIWLGYTMRTTGRFALADRFERFLDRLTNFNPFRRGPRMRVVKDEIDPRKRYQSDEDFNANKKSDQDRVDAILDKISRSGYDSLSKAEKDFLFRQGGG
ncbi:MAG: rhomboid family intramembrane serine protease [Flavobacteriales bacterium]